MKWQVLIGAVIKTLDVIHDVLCPFFRDKNKEDSQDKEKK